ncbi:hypothetical protein [Streptomyces sp. NPDC006285]|uniref:hypothetical protein n=1 Tax=Streptomyces sp. NPDC006285 TaxID=3364742 RepID=UPI0036ACCB9F
MTRIDQLLARARLVDEPYSSKDIDAAAARIAVRAARRALPQKAGAGREQPGERPEPADGAPMGAARDLTVLCETAVADTGAIAHLGTFIGSLPEPRGARVLGCILQLTDQEDSARFWWQYAAGAGDRVATYCLHLQHLVHGERPEARWWHEQTGADLQPTPDGPRDDVATMLRVLRVLHTRRAGEHLSGLLTRLSQAGAVFDYIPAALSYTGDAIDLPLPDPDFTDHITTLTARPSAGTTRERAEPPSPPLPARVRPARRTPPSRTPAAPAPSSAPRRWHDSGGPYGHVQRTGDITSVWRRRLAWQMFFDHCDTCRACDPSGVPCPAYLCVTPSTMIDLIVAGGPPPTGMKRHPIRCAPDRRAQD